MLCRRIRRDGRRWRRAKELLIEKDLELRGDVARLDGNGLGDLRLCGFRFLQLWRLRATSDEARANREAKGEEELVHEVKGPVLGAKAE